MKSLILFFLCLQVALGAEWTLPTANQWNWTAEVYTGVEGGIDQYYPGGASERVVGVNGVDHLNVSLPPYGANPANPSTTATGSAGASSVTVASATGFRVDDSVELVAGYYEVSQYIVSTGASASLNFGVYLNGVTTNVAVTSGDTATQVATKLRAATYTGWTTSGSGTTVIWTADTAGEQYQYLLVYPNGSGVSGTESTVDGGYYSNHTITSISGNTIGITPAIPTAGAGASSAVFRSDNAQAINEAIAAATTGQVIYAPTGDYDIYRPINISSSRDNITFRGAGAGLTNIVKAASMAYMATIGSSYNYTGAELTVTGTKTKGTAALTVSDATGWLEGQIIQVVIRSDRDATRLTAGADLIIDVFGLTDARSYMAEITDVTGNVITVYPPLPSNGTYVDVILKQKLDYPSDRTEFVGLEDMTIDGASITSGTALKMDQTSRCWLRGVEVKDYNNYGIHLNETFRTQAQLCIAGPGRSGGTNSAGILGDKNSAALIVNNIIESNSSNQQENAGSVGNAWVYNASVNNGTGNDLLLNHGAHNMFNLYEGNVAHSWKSDGYFGSASHNVMFRNWFSGYDGTYTGPPGYAKRFTRSFVEAGNVLGYDGFAVGTRTYGFPNIGDDSSFTETSDVAAGDFWNDWGITGSITTRSGDASTTVTVNKLGNLVVGSGSFSNGPTLIWYQSGVLKQCKYLEVTAISGLLVTLADVNGGTSNGDALPANGTAVELWGGQVMFQEKDLAVEPSFTQASNYEAAAVGTGAITDSISPDTLPNSLAYTAQPSWWTDNGFTGTWPPVNPSTPVFSISIIPAGFRSTGTPAPEPPAPSGPTITTGSLSIGGTLSIGN